MPKIMPLTLKSTAFSNNGTIPVLYTCDGRNVSPPLSISDVPFDAQSLVLTLEDLDAALGTWDHWLVFNINPTTTLIPEGEEPIGIHGLGSGDNQLYLGPCPATGEHRYVFTVYALDVMLPLTEKTTKHEILKAMEGHIMAQGQLTGIYGRKK